MISCAVRRSFRGEIIIRELKRQTSRKKKKKTSGFNLYLPRIVLPEDFGLSDRLPVDSLSLTTLPTCSFN